MRAEEGVLRIFTLGRFMVTVGDRVLSDESQRSNKRWKLFQYLVTCRGKTVAPDTLYRELNLNESVNPQEALKALVYRLRNVFRKASPDATTYILSRQGTYQFNREADYWLDAEVFEGLCGEARELVSTSVREAIAAYRRAIVLYGGDYLEGTGGPLSWAVASARNHYHELYIEAVLAAAGLLSGRGEHQEVWKMCELALQIAPFEEELHRISIRALMDAGRRDMARIQYEDMVSLFESNNLSVSPAVGSLGHIVGRKRKGDPGDDPEDLIAVLKTRDRETAFECGTEIFTAICELEKYRSERNERSAVCIMYFSIYGEAPYRELEETREALADALRHRLRKGDVITSWGPRSYVALIVDVDPGRVDGIADRVERAFRERCGLERMSIKSRYQMF